MPSVVLAQVPYVAVQRPSIALSVLKAALTQVGIDSTVVYPNIWWAEEIGLGTYEVVASTQNDDLLGDWIFAGAAFPDFHTDEQAYFELINLDVSQVLFGSREKILEALRTSRNKAPVFIDAVARRIVDMGPRVVGVSSMFAQNNAALALLRRIRELAPDVVTVMGGANCEMPMGGVLLRNFPWVDFVMSGEVDLSWGAFAGAVLEHGRDVPVDKYPFGMMGPAHRAGHPFPGTDGKAARSSTHALDNVPAPDFDDYFRTLEGSPIGAYIHPGLLIETSRGCWWGEKHHCTFCGLNGAGMGFRSRSAERAIDEFDYLSNRYGVSDFLVADNIIATHHYKSLLPLLAAAPQSFNLFYETKSNVRREQMKALQEAGVSWIQPGFESLSDPVLDLIDKGTTAAINVQTMKWARELGMRLSWNILSGFPGEDDAWYAEMAEWVPNIVHLQPPQGVLKFRYDRFSAYQLRAEEFGVHLQPNRRYAFCYPLSPDDLRDIAYFFEDPRDLPPTAAATTDDIVLRQQNLAAAGARSYQEYYRMLMTSATRRGARGQEGEGRRRLADYVEEWLRLFWREMRPILSMTDHGDRVTFFDTRPVAPSRRQEIDGLARRVYLACDQAQSKVGLLGALASDGHGAAPPWDEVEPLLTDLCARRLMLKLSGRYLAIAVAGELPPIPQAYRFPGGYLLARPRVNHPHDAPWRIGDELPGTGPAHPTLREPASATTG